MHSSHIFKSLGHFFLSVTANSLAIYESVVFINHHSLFPAPQSFHFCPNPVPETNRVRASHAEECQRYTHLSCWQWLKQGRTTEQFNTGFNQMGWSLKFAGQQEGIPVGASKNKTLFSTTCHSGGENDETIARSLTRSPDNFFFLNTTTHHNSPSLQNL